MFLYAWKYEDEWHAWTMHKIKYRIIKRFLPKYENKQSHSFQLSIFSTNFNKQGMLANNNKL